MKKNDFLAMSQDERIAAYVAGELEAVLQRGFEHEPEAEPVAVPEGQLTRDDLKTMTPDAIETARREGRLDYMMGVNR